MSEPTFQIVFRGKILSGFDRDQVRNGLAQLFKTSADRMDALLDAPKTVLKSGLTRDAAARYQEVLRQVGIMVAVVGDAPAAAAAVPPLATAASDSPPSPPPAAAPAPVQAEAITTVADAAGSLTLAPAGTTILPPQQRQTVDIDTSALTLAQPGAILTEKAPAVAPEFDLSGITLASDEGPIDRTLKPAAADIDVSALSLAEQPVEAEREPSALQKLLSASIE